LKIDNILISNGFERLFDRNKKKHEYREAFSLAAAFYHDGGWQRVSWLKTKVIILTLCHLFYVFSWVFHVKKVQKSGLFASKNVFNSFNYTECRAGVKWPVRNLEPMRAQWAEPRMWMN